ncbi:MAG: hypothetical protein AAGG08_14030 [Actinomycetota bacterium]
MAPDRVPELVAAMRSLGYRTEVEAPELGVLVFHEAEPANVTSDSWTIRQVTERFGGRYDGWRCEVQRERPRAKRRLFRRR